MTIKSRQTIARTAFLSQLPDWVIEELMSTAQTRSFDRGTEIFSDSDPARHFFVVIEGWVKLMRGGADGSPAVIAIFARNDTFAEAAALASATYPARAEAVTDVRLLAIDGERFLDCMMADRQTLASGLAQIYRHLHGLVREIETLKALNARERLAAFLVQIAGESTGPAAVTLPYDKGLIAAKLGTTPENLSRAFSDLRAYGVTTARGSAHIADLANLRHLANLDGRPGDP